MSGSCTHCDLPSEVCRIVPKPSTVRTSADSFGDCSNRSAVPLKPIALISTVPTDTRLVSLSKAFSPPTAVRYFSITSVGEGEFARVELPSIVGFTPNGWGGGGGGSLIETCAGPLVSRLAGASIVTLPTTLGLWAKAIRWRKNLRPAVN